MRYVGDKEAIFRHLTANSSSKSRDLSTWIVESYNMTKARCVLASYCIAWLWPPLSPIVLCAVAPTLLVGHHICVFTPLFNPSLSITAFSFTIIIVGFKAYVLRIHLSLQALSYTFIMPTSSTSNIIICLKLSTGFARL
jgi:hypothetical protein